MDIKLKFSFSYGYSRMTSRNAKDFYQKLELVYPIYIYPRCPRINAFVERANRTLQDDFIDDNIGLVLEDINQFNAALVDYLVLKIC